MSRLAALARRGLLRTALGAGAFGAAGAAYAYFVGCHTGSCPLTGNVWTAALFFGFTGAVVFAPGARREPPPSPPGPERP